MSENPSDLRYTKDHEWARVEGNRVTIGITKHAVDALGDVTLVNLDVKVGGAVTAGKAFGTVESVKAVSDLYAPVTGKVVDVNRSLDDKPETLNEDPYTAGWMIVVEGATESELGALLDAAAYNALLATL